MTWHHTCTSSVRSAAAYLAAKHQAECVSHEVGRNFDTKPRFDRPLRDHKNSPEVWQLLVDELYQQCIQRSFTARRQVETV
jgi:hypothetical protein